MVYMMCMMQKIWVTCDDGFGKIDRQIDRQRQIGVIDIDRFRYNQRDLDRFEYIQIDLDRFRQVYIDFDRFRLNQIGTDRFG